MILQDIQWLCKPFNQLSAKELHNIYELRQRVFIIEQACIYPDIDDTDLSSQHAMAIDPQDDSLKAYLRFFKRNNETIIGRVTTCPLNRRQKLGSLLMSYALKQIRDQQIIKLSAQYHLVSFYEQFDFKVASEPYNEDGILHILMVRFSNRKN